jgi:hypothetical protein
MKKYTIELVINEQSDEYFEDITKDGNTGCDEILKFVKEQFEEYDVEVRLTKYEDKD